VAWSHISLVMVAIVVVYTIPCSSWQNFCSSGSPFFAMARSHRSFGGVVMKLYLWAS